jgi:hypothetical protein
MTEKHHKEHAKKTVTEKQMEKPMKKAKSCKWMLPASYVLAFLFFVPFSALAGLIFGILSFKKAEKKVGPSIAIALNLLFGYFNLLFTQIFIEVFFLGG